MLLESATHKFSKNSEQVFLTSKGAAFTQTEHAVTSILTKNECMIIVKDRSTDLALVRHPYTAVIPSRMVEK